MLRGAVKIALFSAVAYITFDMYLKLGYDKHFYKHYPGRCQQVKGLDFGSEDLHITTNGQAFISSGISFLPISHTFKDFLKIKNIQGRILLYDFNKPDLGAIELKIKGNLKTFRPHGISFLEDKTKGEHLIYVITHAEEEGGKDAVEKFRFLPKTKELLHLHCFMSDAFYITNDLALVEEDKFYISNFLYFNNHFLSILEQFPYMSSLGSLLFFNGTHASEIVSSLKSPNGIILSNDQRYLYINMPLEGAVLVYDRNKEDNSLSLVQRVNLHTGGDNIVLSHSGDVLYIGAHPIPHKIFDHMTDPSNRAPSSVLQLPLKNGRIVEEEITEVFYDHGELISGSSVAATFNGQLIIGSVIDKLVICDTKFKF